MKRERRKKQILDKNKKRKKEEREAQTRKWRRNVVRGMALYTRVVRNTQTVKERREIKEGLL